MRRSASCVSAGLLVLGTCAAPGSTGCRVVAGEIAQVLIGAGVAAGRATGDLHGIVRIEIDTVWPGTDGVQNLRARHTIVTAPGDSLLTRDRGVMTAVGSTSFLIHNVLSTTRGTGAFDRVRGTIATRGSVDFATGRISLGYQGELCRLDAFGVGPFPTSISPMTRRTG